MPLPLQIPEVFYHVGSKGSKEVEECETLELSGNAGILHFPVRILLPCPPPCACLLALPCPSPLCMPACPPLCMPCLYACPGRQAALVTVQ